MNKSLDYHYDYVIAGAGLSGLALATSLIDARSTKRIAIIEPRVSYERDHIWSCWDHVIEDLSLPFDHRWNKWKVKSRSKTSVCESKHFPYSCIFSESYYKQALDKIENARNIDLFLGEMVERVEFADDSVSIETSARSLSAQYLFDSRPPAFLKTGLQQDFLGLEVETTKDAFDPSCVTLMDFKELKLNANGFHFFYVLPFSERRALVESVFVGFERLPAPQHRQQLVDYLRSDFGVESFNELHCEHGHIPMHPVEEKSTHARHHLIGTRGGLVRPSTGYGFASINRFSDSLAKALQDQAMPAIELTAPGAGAGAVAGAVAVPVPVPGPVPFPLPRTYSSKAKTLDAVLLTFLKERPTEAPSIFTTLFAKVEPDRLIRFLCDASSAADDALIFAAMPRKFELGLIMARLGLKI